MTIGRAMYRWRWAMLAAWVACGGTLVALVPAADPTANEAESFLPLEAPSRQASAEFRAHFPASSGLSEAVAVFERTGGKLTPEDLKAIDAVADRARVRPSDPAEAKDLAGITVRSPGSLKGLDLKPRENPLISPDGQAALVTLSSPANFITVRACKAVDHLKACLDATPLPEGLHADITGSAGYGHDYLEAARSSHDKTLKITIAAVILILLLVYRSPGAAMVPVVAVSAAVVVAAKVPALGTHVGLHVGTAEMIFVYVLMYGAGVDYSLMLVSRYRELLDEGMPGPVAAAEALDATLPAILASAGTNTVGVFMLTFATHGVFHTSGPVIAIALVCALVAALTLVPAMLAAIGPRIFWPTHRMGQMPGPPSPARGWSSWRRSSCWPSPPSRAPTSSGSTTPSPG
ncbi:MAG: MMPL family transporter [Planctomycetota bacterium]|nr:MMPL family transporter [Planctomycetota bacterium]